MIEITGTIQLKGEDSGREEALRNSIDKLLPVVQDGYRRDHVTIEYDEANHIIKYMVLDLKIGEESARITAE